VAAKPLVTSRPGAIRHGSKEIPLHGCSYAIRPESHRHAARGGVRTALFSWLYARRMGCKFILRVEDTDREPSTIEAVRVILEGMAGSRCKPTRGLLTRPTVRSL